MVSISSKTIGLVFLKYAKSIERRCLAASEVVQLMETVKRQLKAQGKTYRGVAKALRLSEPSVKRVFTIGRFSIDRIAAIGKLQGYPKAALAAEVLPIWVLDPIGCQPHF